MYYWLCSFFLWGKKSWRKLPVQVSECMTHLPPTCRGWKTILMRASLWLHPISELVRIWLSLSLPHWSSTVTYMIRSLSIPLNAYFFHCEGCPIYTIRTGSPNWWRFVIDCDDPSPLISSQHACRRSSVVLYTYNECHHEPSPILKYCYTSLACLFLLFAGRRDPSQTVSPYVVYWTCMKVA